MFNEELQFKPAIRWGMVGGGRGSQIGYSHRCAAQRDGLFKLMAGAFDLNAERGRSFGTNLGLSTERCYPDYTTMFTEEAKRPDGIEAVSIATPNATHYEICKAALHAGLHVVCEKPITFTSKEASELQSLAEQQQRKLAVMYGYSGYPMIHQAREMVRRGDLGEIRVVNMQFAHGSHNIEHEKNDPGLKWRVSPQVAGPTYVLGDIGTHIFYLCEMITGLEVSRLSCMKQAFIRSRAPLEDNAHVMLEYTSGAVGTLWASAVNAGAMHQQKFRIVGEKASIEWWDEHPNQLRYEVQGEPARVLERGSAYLYNDAAGVAASHIGVGHPEGYFESWANLYHRFALAFTGQTSHDESPLWYPDVYAGINGVRLCEKCVESATSQSQWVSFY
ncbi:Gfo/Idh/MocA family protein [Salinimonas lutimaris]|uniref:Gfo/Idh/MocA family protein n=1 Tax=Salinimonas lutimaris TaxID=914153 RepID=UPI0010C0EBFA|nr:Gfo/Idh/MocA family oxidoreductase [Salinimonas lutimaris]